MEFCDIRQAHIYWAELIEPRIAAASSPCRSGEWVKEAWNRANSQDKLDSPWKATSRPKSPRMTGNEAVNSGNPGLTANRQSLQVSCHGSLVWNVAYHLLKKSAL